MDDLWEPPQPEPRTLREIWTWWRGLYLEDLVDQQTFTHQVEDLVLPELGALYPAQLRPSSVKELLNKLRDRGFSAETRNHVRSRISRILHDAIGEGLWRGNPVIHVAAAEIPERVWPTLSVAEARVLIASSRGAYRNLWAITVYLGPRKGELLGLELGDIDQKARILTITRSHGRATTKNRKSRRVPITSELWPYFRSQIRAAKASRSLYLFPNRVGGRRRRDTPLGARLRAALKRAGVTVGWRVTCRWCKRSERLQELPTKAVCLSCDRQLWMEPIAKPLRYHDLRHTFATLAASAGVEREVRRLALGHRGDSTSIYEHGVEWVRAELGKLTLRPRRRKPR